MKNQQQYLRVGVLGAIAPLALLTNAYLGAAPSGDAPYVMTEPDHPTGINPHSAYFQMVHEQTAEFGLGGLFSTLHASGISGGQAVLLVRRFKGWAIRQQP